MHRPEWLESVVWPAADWAAACAAAAIDGDDRPTWAYPWPAGERLARDLPDLLTESRLTPRSCIDLGCGRGYLGMRARLALPDASVCWQDGSPHPLQWVASVIAANHWRQSFTMVSQWGNQSGLAPADLVLGGDILYRPECFTVLMQTLATSLSPNGVAWFSDPRTHLEDSLPHVAHTHGLSWSQRRQSDYTLVSIRRRDAPIGT